MSTEITIQTTGSYRLTTVLTAQPGRMPWPSGFGINLLPVLWMVDGGRWEVGSSDGFNKGELVEYQSERVMRYTVNKVE